MYKTCVIGAGAAGLIAAIEASSDRSDVIMIDKNKKAGMKLYATGNGRCNLANMHMAFSCYYGNAFSTEILGEKPADTVISYMKELGIDCYDKNGYVYPRSSQASAVVWALLDRLRENNVKLKVGTEVGEIKPAYGTEADEAVTGGARAAGNESEKSFYVIYDKDGSEICRAENVILATGGYSAPKLGAASEKVSSSIYDSLGIKYSAAKPALCPMICKPVTDSAADMTELSGIRSNARVTVTMMDGKTESEEGEVQFTDYGLSGIVVFDLSYFDDIKSVNVNTLYEVDKDSFISTYEKVMTACPGRSVQGFLNGYINDKLAAFIVNKVVGIDVKTKLGDTEAGFAETLYDAVSNLEFSFEKLYGYEHSQVTKGGILCDEMDASTMMLKDRRGLYAVGEAVDVCGKCGGYNLMWAFISGMIAGRDAKAR